ncbi:hypothetical protein ACFWCB_05205 [Streptomyces sp. NPDC060048]|uniref:hypothetical protein n=1 Tax=unclassified Streptomyces TaxID=2593676 RepID=UPI0036CB9665
MAEPRTPQPARHTQAWRLIDASGADDGVHTTVVELPAHLPQDADEIRRQVTDRGVSWPWTSNDPLIAAAGIIGNDPRTATPALGAHLLEEAVAAAVPALEILTGRKSRCP